MADVIIHCAERKRAIRRQLRSNLHVSRIDRVFTPTVNRRQSNHGIIRPDTIIVNMLKNYVQITGNSCVAAIRYDRKRYDVMRIVTLIIIQLKTINTRIHILCPVRRIKEGAFQKSLKALVHPSTLRSVLSHFVPMRIEVLIIFTTI